MLVVLVLLVLWLVHQSSCDSPAAAMAGTGMTAFSPASPWARSRGMGHGAGSPFSPLARSLSGPVGAALGSTLGV